MNSNDFHVGCNIVRLVISLFIIFVLILEVTMPFGNSWMKISCLSVLLIWVGTFRIQYEI